MIHTMKLQNKPFELIKNGNFTLKWFNKSKIIKELERSLESSTKKM